MIVGVLVIVGVIVGVRVTVGVRVMVGVAVMVGVLVTVEVAVGVAVKLLMLPVTMQLPHPGKLKVRLISQMPSQVVLLKSAIHCTSVPFPLIGNAGGVDVVFTGELTMLVAEGS